MLQIVDHAYLKKTCFQEKTSGKQTEDLDRKSPYLRVVAIDFGTTYSGWAFSSRYEFENNQSVHTHNWYVDSCPPSKTDTCILFDAEEELVAFGHNAKEKYLGICEEGKEDDYLFFSNFKMVLYENSVRAEL